MFPPRSTTTCFERLQSICLLLQFKFIKELNGLMIAGKLREYPCSPIVLHVKTTYGKTLFNRIVCVSDNLIPVDEPDLWLILELEKVSHHIFCGKAICICFEEVKLLCF